jgi:hypothetical protein
MSSPTQRATPLPAFGRRSFLGAAAALGAVLAGCATPSPPISATISEPRAAPRVGDTWRYAYASGWPQDPPRVFTCRVVEVTPAGIRDELSATGIAGARSDDFGGRLELLSRSLGAGFAVMELTPYLQAFVALAPGQTWFGIPMPVGAAPLTPWSARARVAGVAPITTPAGTFDAVRVDLSAMRAGSGISRSADTAQMQGAAWFAPQVKRVVRFDYNTWTLSMIPMDRQSYQLLDFSPA